MEELFVAVAKCLTILLDSRKRHGRIAEARMTIKEWWTSRCHVASSRVESVVEALPSNLAGSRRRWVVGARMWM